MDTNGDGRISAAEYGAWLHTIGLTPTEREMKELMLQNDKNGVCVCVCGCVDVLPTITVTGDGKLDFKEYVAFLETQASKISPEEWNAVVFHVIQHFEMKFFGILIL